MVIYQLWLTLATGLMSLSVLVNVTSHQHLDGNPSNVAENHLLKLKDKLRSEVKDQCCCRITLCSVLLLHEGMKKNAIKCAND